MIRSMTGFGRGVATSNQTQITVEVRSVNHRYLEIGLKFPKEWIGIELASKKTVSSFITRGKIDVYLSIQPLTEEQKKLSINWSLVDAYEQAKTALQEKIAIEKTWTMAELSTIDNLLTIESELVDEQQMQSLINQAMTTALQQLVFMREREGQELHANMVLLINDLKNQIATIELHKEDAVAKYQERLINRLQQLVEGDEVDQRILTEVAIYADRIDITEELDRLKSHFVQLDECMNDVEAVGRKFEFILQEIHREVNTIGSKNQSVKCSPLVVQCKMILEKLREQVQNIE